MEFPRLLPRRLQIHVDALTADEAYHRGLGESIAFGVAFPATLFGESTCPETAYTVSQRHVEKGDGRCIIKFLVLFDTAALLEGKVVGCRGDFLEPGSSILLILLQRSLIL